MSTNTLGGPTESINPQDAFASSVVGKTNAIDGNINFFQTYSPGALALSGINDYTLQADGCIFSYTSTQLGKTIKVEKSGLRFDISLIDEEGGVSESVTITPGNMRLYHEKYVDGKYLSNAKPLKDKDFTPTTGFDDVDLIDNNRVPTLLSVVAEELLAIQHTFHNGNAFLEKDDKALGDLTQKLQDN